MRFSQYPFLTYREEPSDIQHPGLRRLVRGAYIRFIQKEPAWTPLGIELLRHINTVWNQKMQEMGIWECSLPEIFINPVNKNINPHSDESYHHQFKMHFRALFTHWMSHEINSYRQLPASLYRFSVPNNQPWIEFAAVHLSVSDAERELKLISEKIEELFRYFKIPYKMIQNQSLLPSKAFHQATVIPINCGKEVIVHCSTCTYKAISESASFNEFDTEKDKSEKRLQKVETPGKETIHDVAEYLKVGKNKTLKAVFYRFQDQLVFVVIRGDLEVNEYKLKHYLGTSQLEMADDELLKSMKMVPGYASPIDLPDSIRVIADRSVYWGNNFVAGANEPGYHFINVNIPRDVKIKEITDIGFAKAGYPCPECLHGNLCFKSCERIGEIHTEKSTKAEKIEFLNKSGQRDIAAILDGYINLHAFITAAAALNFDENGLIWPMNMAPYPVHLTVLAKGPGDVLNSADRLYGRLRAAGLKVLYDDRFESPGVKFNDADLLGMPLRVTVSKRNLKNGLIEMKSRCSDNREMADLEKAPGMIQAFLNILS